MSLKGRKTYSVANRGLRIVGAHNRSMKSWPWKLWVFSPLGPTLNPQLKCVTKLVWIVGLSRCDDFLFNSHITPRSLKSWNVFIYGVIYGGKANGLWKGLYLSEMTVAVIHLFLMAWLTLKVTISYFYSSVISQMLLSQMLFKAVRFESCSVCTNQTKTST